MVAGGLRWGLGALALSGVVLAATLVPSALGGFPATLGGPSPAGSGVVAERVDTSCSATGPTGPDSTCPNTTTLLPSPDATSTFPVSNTGTLGETVGLSVSSCGVATVASAGSAAEPSVVHGGFDSASYNQPGGPLGGVSVLFPGASSFVSSNGAGSPGPLSFTELAWFKAGPAQDGAIMGFANASVPAGASSWDRQLWIDPSGHLVAGVYPGSIQEVTSTTTVTDGNWHLASVTLGPTGLSLYLDGVLQATDTAAITAQVYSGWWSIGAAKLASWTDAPVLTGGVSYFQGFLAGLAVLPSPLDTAQIADLFHSSSFSTYTNLVGSLAPLDSWMLQDPGATSVTQLGGPGAGDYPDISGSSDNATPNGALTTTPTGGPLGGGTTTFPGPSSFVSTAGPGSPGPDTFTELAWFKAGPAQDGAIMGFANASVPAGASSWDRQLWIDPSGHLVAGVYPGSIQEVTSTTTVTDGNWHLASVTLGPTGLSLYLDGVLQATDTAAITAQVYSGWWSIGAAKLAYWPDAPPLTAGVSYFEGSLAGVAVLPGVLDTAQIAGLYQSASFSSYTSTVQADTPLVDWPLTALDQSGVCNSVLATIATTSGGTTTCMFPPEPNGTACPPGANGLPLTDLESAPATSPSPTVPGATTTLSIATADASGVSASLVGADVIVDLVVSGVNGPWGVQAAFPNSETAL